LSWQNEDLTQRFETHEPSETGVQGIKTLRQEFILIAKAVDEIVPDGREKSLALTNLEQALFWANAGVARHG
jgi:hypothetical protein